MREIILGEFKLKIKAEFLPFLLLNPKYSLTTHTLPLRYSGVVIIHLPWLCSLVTVTAGIVFKFENGLVRLFKPLDGAIPSQDVLQLFR